MKPQSELFTANWYKVTMPKDGSMMTFTADIDGKCRCTDGCITIPRLKMLIPFNGRKEYEAIELPGSGFMIKLR